MQTNESVSVTKTERDRPVPPGSIVRLVNADNFTPLWKGKEGTRYRIGYYSKQDGFDVIWLVDDKGDYCETVDNEFLLKYFQIEFINDETDYYGDRPCIGPVSCCNRKAEKESTEPGYMIDQINLMEEN